MSGEAAVFLNREDKQEEKHLSLKYFFFFRKLDGVGPIDNRPSTE